MPRLSESLGINNDRTGELLNIVEEMMLGNPSTSTFLLKLEALEIPLLEKLYIAFAVGMDEGRAYTLLALKIPPLRETHGSC